MLELEEDDDIQYLDDIVGISLHALTGIRTGQTMRLAVSVNNDQLHALVDSGLTHVRGRGHCSVAWSEDRHRDKAP